MSMRIYKFLIVGEYVVCTYVEFIVIFILYIVLHCKERVCLVFCILISSVCVCVGRL